MSFTITKGYLLTKINHLFFDEIITFLSTTGNVFTCLSRGSKKISSKNARNLIYFSLIEFEFFNSRQPNSVGKLMRAKKVENVTSNAAYISATVENASLLFVNEMICKLKISGLPLFSFYEYLMKTKEKFSDNYILIIYSLISFVKILGWKIFLDKCAICSKTKIFNFSTKANGFVCMDCNSEYFKCDKNIIKILFYVYKKEYIKASEFNNNTKKNALKILLNFYYESLSINLYSLLMVF